MLKRLAANARNHRFIALQIVLLFGIGLALRYKDLGYSDFQMDEIGTLCRVFRFKSLAQFLAFLLGKPKGPVQYLITCAYGILDPTFSSELALRLPFAFANFAALILFFLLVYRLFTLNVAIYSSFLLATNGIFVAFARIVQYQSIVILGVVVAVLGLTLAVQDARWRAGGIYIGFTAAAMALLAHFDAVFVLPPMVLLVAHWWNRVRHHKERARFRGHLLAAASIFTFLVLSFYIEYAMRLSPSLVDSWGRRFTSDPTDILRLFRFYNPGPVLWIYLVSIGIGLTQIGKRDRWHILIVWLIPPLLFMEVVFKDSRTHAYTYLLPLLIVAGLGLDTFFGWLYRTLQGRYVLISRAFAMSLFMVLAYMSFEILVDHHPEYPWHKKQVLNMRLAGGFLKGTFGFPYSRQWRQIGSWLDQLPQSKVVLVTNEKPQIAEFYLPSSVRYGYISQKFPPQEITDDGVYVLIVQRPQSWMARLWGWPMERWQEELVPQRDFVNAEGQTVASVYFLDRHQFDAHFH